MKNNKLLFFIIVILFYGCKKTDEPILKEPARVIEEKLPQQIIGELPRQAIRDLEQKFPLLIQGQEVVDRTFKLIRTVIDGETNVQIQLYAQDEKINYSHKIIVFINKKNKCVAIPLFNNRQRDYWQFANDNLLRNVPKVNTTFEKEYNDAISFLRKEKTFKNYYVEINILKELFESVLHTQRLESMNGSLQLCKLKQAVTDIPIENEDSVKVRFEKNYKEIEKGCLNPIYFYSLDKDNDRVYRISYDEKEQKFKFKVYRQDFGAKPIQPMYL